MSYVLGVARPDTFAAIATVGGTRRPVGRAHRFPSFVGNTPSRPMPLLHIHGTSDEVVPYDGGLGFFRLSYSGVETVVGEWANANGCSLTPSALELPNNSTIDDSTVTVLSYGDCDTYTSVANSQVAADVLLYRLNGAGHSWPVLEPERPAALSSISGAFWENALSSFVPLNSDFSASAEIWRFFEQHSVPISDCMTGTGDFDDNGKVEFADFLVLSANFGLAADDKHGDIDCNGEVEFADFLILSSNFGLDVVESQAVPEPLGCALYSIGVLSMGFLRRRRTANSLAA